MINKISSFEKRIRITFKNKRLIEQVFVHRSYLNENPGFALENNERLEFLGDAVLELVVTEYLYNNYPNPEGELTNWRSALVRGQMLSKISDRLGINDLLYLSKGESVSIGKARQIILANAFEALIGAIYLDRGYNKAKQLISRELLIHLDEILEKGLYKDAKSCLQEIAQDTMGITPRYSVIEESGPDHNKKFIIGVYIGEKLYGQGDGSSKQEAEQSAAEDGLDKVN